MITEIDNDARWGTRNTKLASCLLVMGFKLARQPFSTVLEVSKPELGYQTTVWFTPAITSEEIGEVNAEQVRIEFDSDSDAKWSFVLWMKRALQARDWLINKVLHGGHCAIDSDTAIQSDWLRVETLALAAPLLAIVKAQTTPSLADALCFMGYRRRGFYFAPGHVARALVASVGSEEPAKAQGAMNFGNIAIRQQDILMGVINNPRRMQELHIKEGERELYMDAKGGRNFQRAMLHEFYNPSPK